MRCPILLPGALSELFAQATSSGYMTKADRYGLMAALLEDELGNEERFIIDRLLRAVKRGRLRLADELSAVTMETAISFSAIVLAGGQSSRMGQDKALIPFQGVPLLRQVCDVALNCTDEVFVVTPWLERYQDVIPTRCQVIREVPPLGETPSQGPLLGFAEGLKRVKTHWVLLLACDMPHLQTKVLQTWAKELPKTSNDTIAVLPRHPKGWEPLCGFYRRQSQPLLTQYINQGGRSFQDWLAQHRVRELSVSDRKILFNCNTPEELGASL
ncbi:MULTISPECIES: molybdenum cofactor guanylyltransferase [unclassified Coleofasciculus]|uniref:molybdenum cofactor guanylyltransferase n=1 Tax=unclassified Coleofasciculus TaxID=2692782 RepID=UPI001882541D|nr:MULTISPECIES: molybdenum cofactor guanylyltransferase [unclassified Coleofasciculus]MBE9127779.1 molybdenum cofactor guanylyltransferase [Coleofasciculus sp. LEGE 07081]MBE9148586.1 molybdenum cofactor guanylyltransferase [Coleofasciculus sp. LEGE 07092]